MRLLTAGSLVRVQLGEPNKRDTNSVSFLFAFPRVVLLEPTSLRRESEANEQRGRSDKKTIDDCFSWSRAKAVLVAQDVVRVLKDTNSVSLLFAFPVDSPTPASERFAGVTALRKQSGGLFLASNGQKLCFLPGAWFES